MASRRRRQKSIGSVVNDVKRRVTNIEKRPGATRLKRNVVTGEKIQYRTVPTKAIQPDAITANEAEFGVPIVSDTEPTDYLKAGTLWINPDDGSAKAYDLQNNEFVPISDVNAQATADGKNKVYRQNSQPSGGVYVTGDLWFDTDDDNKIYRYNSATSTWVGFTLGDNALASISANKITAGTIDARIITVSYLDAGSITSGTMSADRISGGTITGALFNLSGTNSYGAFSITNTLRYGSPSLTWGPTATPSFEIYQFGGGDGTVINAGGIDGYGYMFINALTRIEMKAPEVFFDYTIKVPSAPSSAGAGGKGIRNIYSYTSLPSAASFVDGDIVVVY